MTAADPAARSLESGTAQRDHRAAVVLGADGNPLSDRRRLREAVLAIILADCSTESTAHRAPLKAQSRFAPSSTVGGFAGFGMRRPVVLTG